MPIIEDDCDTIFNSELDGTYKTKYHLGDIKPILISYSNTEFIVYM